MKGREQPCREPPICMGLAKELHVDRHMCTGHDVGNNIPGFRPNWYLSARTEGKP